MIHLEEEVSRSVVVSLAYEGIHEGLQVSDRCCGCPIALVCLIGRRLHKECQRDEGSRNVMRTYGGPTSFCYVHLGLLKGSSRLVQKTTKSKTTNLVAQTGCRLDICLLEELVCPRRGVLNGYVREPGVYVGHLSSNVSQELQITLRHVHHSPPPAIPLC